MAYTVKLYDHDICDIESIEEVREYLSIELEIPIEDISDEAVWDSLNRLKEDEWHYLLEDFKEFVDPKLNTLLSWGTSHNYYWGKSTNILYQKHDIVKSMEWDRAKRQFSLDDRGVEEAIRDLIDGCIGCEDLDVIDENGLLTVKLYHHDGVETYHFKEMTERGVDLYNRWYNEESSRLINLDEDEIFEKIIESSNYSRLPRVAEKMGYNTKTYRAA